MRQGYFAFAVCLSILAACSSEALPPPPPEAQHAGAFVAFVADGETDLSLLRTLKAVRIEGDTILFTTLYDVTPRSWEEAQQIAQQPAIPIRQLLLTFSAELLAARPHRVVWFRTLTKAEGDRSP